MKTILNTYAYLLMLVVATLLVACSDSSVPEVPGQEGAETPEMGPDSTYTYAIEFNCIIEGFDGDSRAATYWPDGSKVYLKMKDGSSNVYGSATYSADERSWSVTMNATPTPSSNFQTLETVYIENPVSVTSSNVEMNQHSVLYMGAGTYIYKDKTYYVDVTLKPQTWRMRFKGAPDKTVAVTVDKGVRNIRFYNKFNPKTFGIEKEWKRFNLTVNSSGYTDYIYGIFESEELNQLIINIDPYTYRAWLTPGSSDYAYSYASLNPGESGVVNLPKPYVYLSNWYMVDELEIEPETPNNLANYSSITVKLPSNGLTTDLYRTVYSKSEYDGLDGSSRDATIANYLLNNSEPVTGTLEDWVFTHRGLKPETKYVWCFLGVGSDGTVGRLITKEVTTKSAKNQPECSISFIGLSTVNGKLEWNYKITPNSKVSRYYVKSYAQEQSDGFVAWIMSQNFSSISSGTSASNSTWTSTTDKSQTDLYLYVWARDGQGNMSGIVNKAHFTRSGNRGETAPESEGDLGGMSYAIGVKFEATPIGIMDKNVDVAESVKKVN